MRFTIDHDLHIHTRLSICSDDPDQTPESILRHAKETHLKTICITDHYWDSAVPCTTAVNWWYEKQNFEHISQSLPLPQSEDVRFLFGCETDVDSINVLGVPESRWNDFDFIIISTTHFHHMSGPLWEDKSPEAIAKRWVERLDAVLNMKLPFHKVGIAHLATGVIGNPHEATIAVLKLLPKDEMHRLFTKAATLGVGIELNADNMSFTDEEADVVLPMFRIAKACGCKFYLGSDAHERHAFNGVTDIFERAITLLDLKESDKFIIQ